MRPDEALPPAGAAVDLSNCDREPIHTPGAVQPHGVLLVLDEPDLTVSRCSANAGSLLGVGAAELVGREAGPFFTRESWLALRDALSLPDPREAGPLTVVSGGGRTLDALVHRHAGLLFLELEPAGAIPALPGEAERLVRFVLARLQGELRVGDLCRALAREVRAMTGFDRVMVYRFDEEYNGEVVAEEKADGLEPFLGLHYPASDVPAQARRLYELNWVRHIPDVTYDASPLVPPGGGPTDLSFAALRSVSPIHVEYLKNMGVAASLSVSIMKGGRLWGLVACHHYVPRFVPARLRAACESLGVMASLQLSAKADVEEAQQRAEARSRLVRLADAVASAPDAAGLAASGDDLLALAGASGVAVALGGRVACAGACPPAEAVTRLVAWLGGVAVGEEGTFATSALPASWAEAAAFADRASGLLASCVSREAGDWVLWFRPEAIRAVDWAGDPHDKRVVTGPNGPRLSPRGSFSLWREQQRGRSLPWTEVDREAAGDLRGVLLSAQARRARELAEESRRKDEFLAVLAHELRNPLAPIANAVQAMRLRHTDDPHLRAAREVVARQAEQLSRLVDDLLDVSRVTQGKVRLRKERTDLESVVARAVEASRPLVEAGGHSLAVSLPAEPLRLDADPARLTQVVTNLLNNAAKYTPHGGHVWLSVTREAAEAVLRVRDDGVGIAPEMLGRVFDLFSQADRSLERSQGGLGVGLSLTRALVGLHGGSVLAHSEGHGKGSEFVVRLPLAEGDASARGASEGASRSRGCRVLVVDDNEDSADSLAMLLRLTGHEARTAGDGLEAVERAEGFRPELILMDLGLPRLNGYEACRRIRERPWGAGVLVVACTGYGQEADRRRATEAGFDRHLLKPVDPRALAEVLAAACPVGP